MNDEVFVKVLNKAISGDIKACYEIICLYTKEIEKVSRINGHIDYECVSYIQDKLVNEIKKYKSF